CRRFREPGDDRSDDQAGAHAELPGDRRAGRGRRRVRSGEAHGRRFRAGLSPRPPATPRPRCSHADKSRLRVGLSQLPGTTASKAAYHRDNRSPRESPMMELSLTVNGRRCTVHVDPATTLVEVLRDELGLTGTKIGCDRGACSACTVWIDGEVAASCMTFALDARDKQVTTIEGLAQGEQLHPVQQAFVEHDALQCGFCTPGMVMSCAHLVERNPDCNLDDVRG